MRRLTLLALAAAALATAACSSPTAPEASQAPGVNLECKGEMNGSSTKC